MKIRPELSGLHSRSEAFIKTSQDFERSRATEDQLLEQLRKDKRELISLQQGNAFEVLSDGQLGWQDQLRPFTESLEGVSQGANYSRWFDTNTFYRKPNITGKIHYTYKFAESLAKQADFKGNEEKRPAKVSIVGPATFFDLSDNTYYRSEVDFVNDYLSVVADLSTDLEKKGYKVLQVSEPTLVHSDLHSHRDSRLLRDFVKTVNSKLGEVKLQVEFHTFFGDAAKLWNLFSELEVDYIGADFSYTTVEKLRSLGSNRGVFAGILDARNSLIEDRDQTMTLCETLIEKLEPKELVLAATTDLKFLPRSIADSKLVLLSRVAKELDEKAN